MPKSLQTTRVVLDITWDNQQEEHPANWDWAGLLDMPPLTEGDDGAGFALVSAD